MESFELGVQVRALGGQKYWLNALRLQYLLESRRELAVAVHQYIAFALEEAVLDIDQVPGNLLHPAAVRIGCAAGEVNPTGGNLHHKQ